MAIYHLSAKIISRANGSSALAAAAYRSASRLHDALATPQIEEVTPLQITPKVA